MVSGTEPQRLELGSTYPASKASQNQSISDRKDSATYSDSSLFFFFISPFFFLARSVPMSLL